MHAYLIIVAALFLLGSELAGQPIPGGPIRLYLWTAHPPIIDLDQQDREDAIKNISARLDKKVVIVVASREESEIQVEVTRRGLEPTGGMEPRPGFFSARAEPTRKPTIFATLYFREYETKLLCADTAEIATWRNAGGECANQIKKWIRANVSQIRPQ